MIKSFIATTREMDDSQVAVDEILAALDLEKNLLKNSLGIVSCFSEFEETGVLKAICDALPFDCIGATTCLSAAAQEIDQMIFVVTLLTSDDCDFKTSVIPIDENYKDSIASSMSEILGLCEEIPSLLLGYFPLINAIGGDMILSAIDKATNGIPVFGTVAIDHNADYSTTRTIHNGISFAESVILGVVYGNVNVSFEIAALNKEKIRKQKAIITKSNANLLIGVNGKNVREYLQDIGLTESEFLGIVPFVIEHKDGSKPIPRAVYAFTSEGWAVCGGAMPEDATLSIGRIDSKDVLDTTSNSFKSFVEKDSFILSYSCLARYFALGLGIYNEAEIVRNLTEGENCHFAYSGGEICPLPDANGKLKNYFHNYSIVLCKLS